MRLILGLLLMLFAGYLGFQDEIINSHWTVFVMGLVCLIVGWYNAFIGLLIFTKNKNENRTNI